MMNNDIKSISMALMLDILAKLDNSNGFMVFDVRELAEKHDTSIGCIKEGFSQLEDDGTIDIVALKEEADRGKIRTIGVILKDDPNRKQLLKIINDGNK
jgi:DNA-binding transcriptional regulator YhcF (GntR family)